MNSQKTHNLSPTFSTHKKTTLNSAAVSNELVRHLYAASLLALPIDKAKKLWQQHPLNASKDGRLFTHLFTGKGFSKFDYLARLYESLEKFLLGSGVDPLKFIHKTLVEITPILLVSVKSFLLMSNKNFKLFFSSDDLRTLIINSIEGYNEKVFKGIMHDIVKVETKADEKSCIMLVMLYKTVGSNTCQKKQFCDVFPSFDSELWIVNIVKHFPLVFKLPPYEKYFLLADSRPPKDVIWSCQLQNYNDNYYVQGKKLFEKIEFNKFCCKKGLSLKNYAIPNTTCFLALEDYYCPIRQRVVIHKGCCYGAPVILYGLQYRAFLKPPEDFFSYIVGKAFNEQEKVWDKVNKIHNKVISSIASTIDITYYKKEESISINGKHFIKNIPAKIFRKMLIRHLQDGTTEFEHRDFLRDPEIVGDQLSPNFVVRLNRLASTLEKKVPNIRILKNCRGIINLKLSRKIKYTEI